MKDKVIEFEKNASVLPMHISKTGNPNEPLSEIIICTSISGGADFVDDMPKGLTLLRKLADGREYKAKYTLHEERPSVFVKHIENHLREHKINGQVLCKICGKTIDEIYKEEAKSQK